MRPCKVKVKAHLIAFRDSKELKRFNSATGLKQRLATLGIAARHFPAIRPQQKDVQRLDAYARYLIYGCRARHTNFHYDYLPALGCTLSHLALWKQCARGKAPFLIIEQNCTLKGAAKAGAALLDCVRVFHEEGLDLLMLHLWPDTGQCVCPRPHKDLSQSTVVARLRDGDVQTLKKPESSTKMYLISPQYAAHLVRLCSVTIPSYHVDLFMSLNATKFGGKWRGALYEPHEDYFVVVTERQNANRIPHGKVTPCRPASRGK